MPIPKPLNVFPPISRRVHAREFERAWKPAVDSVRALKGLEKRPVTFTFFHNRDERTSCSVLAALKAADSPTDSEPPKKTKGIYNTIKAAKLHAPFELEVVERVPSAEECDALVRCKVPRPSFLYFLRSQDLERHPTNGQGLHDVLSANPKLLKWPIVVNWDTGDIMVGKDRPAFRQLLRPLELLAGSAPHYFKTMGHGATDRAARGTIPDEHWDKLQ